MPIQQLVRCLCVRACDPLVCTCVLPGMPQDHQVRLAGQSRGGPLHRHVRLPLHGWRRRARWRPRAVSVITIQLPIFFLELVITDRLLGYHAQGHGPPTRLCRGRSFLPDTARFQVLLGVDVRPRRYLLRRILVYQPEDFNREWSPRFSTLWGIETAGSEPKRFDI